MYFCLNANQKSFQHLKFPLQFSSCSVFDNEIFLCSKSKIVPEKFIKIFFFQKTKNQRGTKIPKLGSPFDF